MTDVLAVHIADCWKQLLEKEVTSDVFSESIDFRYNVKQFILAVLKSQKLSVIVIWWEFASHEFDDVWMIQMLQTPDLNIKLIPVTLLNAFDGNPGILLCGFCVFARLQIGPVHIRSKPRSEVFSNLVCNVIEKKTLCGVKLVWRQSLIVELHDGVILNYN